MVKDFSGVDLVAAIRTVGSGRALLDRRAAAALFGRLRSAAPPPGPLAGLTEQEHTTLELTGQGLSNRQIAGRMFVAEKTVKNYVSHVLAKLGMTSRTQVAVLAATEVRDHQPRPGLTARGVVTPRCRSTDLTRAAGSATGRPSLAGDIPVSKFSREIA